VVSQARSPAFYADMGVSDSLEGRFDLLVLHLHLVVRRLSRPGLDGGASLGQKLFDTFFHDMDRTLRAIGVGDMSVGKKVKDMVRAYYGRCAVYEEALADAGDAALVEALSRNVFAGGDGDAESLAAYVRRAQASIDAQPEQQILSGSVAFPPVGGGA
jgi:cytochrome b pre-mRNA-processing protein 3